jgi:hypothetical protein
MKRAFFMKHNRENAIRQGRYDLLIHPKKINRKGAARITVTYEDVTKDSVWLEINARISPDMRVAFECPSRYPKITSLKFKFLQRLSFKLSNLDLYDVVPFTLGIEYLYSPFSYLGREILGFPHWYAFREGYSEMQPDGRVINSLSAEALGPKIAKVARFEYSQFSASRAEQVVAQCSQSEIDEYARMKVKAFAEHKTPMPVVTVLADYSHACQSRVDAIVESARPGDAVFCNLASFAARLNRLLPKGAKAYSYAKPPSVAPDRVVIAEPSIANDYQQFDAEALAESVLYVKSNLPVDAYLHGRQDAIRHQIDELTREATR